MVLTVPPPSIVSIGGYRFALRELHDLVSQVEHGSGALAVLPDVHAGHRLAGICGRPRHRRSDPGAARRQPAAGRRLQQAPPTRGVSRILLTGR
jgi:hypothetical protein